MARVSLCTTARPARRHAAVSACICCLDPNDSAVASSRRSCNRCGGRALGPVRSASRGIAMKPAPFDYQSPGTLREAIDLLASTPEALVIAGGQSLMPVLAFRLATPSLLVDLR